MKSELIIDVRPKEVSIAVLENSRLVELQREKQNIAYSVGDIYLGKVKKIMPGLNAAFVDIGHKKEAFLHYRDLGANFKTAKSFIQAARKYGKNFSPERVKLEKEIDRSGSIADMLQQGEELMVQVTKEAISTKGPRISTELSYAGRYLVLIPFADKVSVSQKISQPEERVRLKQLILSIKPKNVSVIVRTSAQGVKVAELHHELRSLVKKWSLTVENLSREPQNNQPQAAKGGKKGGNNTPDVYMLHQESNRLLSLLRDTYNSNFKDIYINDKSLVQETQDYIELIDPGHGNIVKLYEGKRPIYDYFDVSKQIKHLFGKTVTYKSGAYLVIEQTEAMHVVDVNSGNRSRGSKQQEDTAVDVNLSAAEEIARQMRLRDLGGIIIIDFIDMAQAANRQKLFEQMNEYMKNDRAKHTILPLTKFGLMQITRQRVRQATRIETEEVCPTCHGKGQVQPTLFFTDEVEKMVNQLTKEEGVKKFSIHLHPFVAAYLTKKKGFLGGSILSSWRSKYGKGIDIIADESLGMLEYEFYDSDKNELSYMLDTDDEDPSLED
ncbi:Rne/Rng family ribonuclease [uncultured Porphyromonas sp.]|uniref:Rne/Rng family ribonuclease n=1 Tax=uncultured Porphyromonas sp. TaxID=159274 RepID=UPI002598DFD1|nr:Rne/Rng family ribonuclease [uncultured Porphyromonas sp.]